MADSNAHLQAKALPGFAAALFTNAGLRPEDARPRGMTTAQP